MAVPTVEGKLSEEEREELKKMQEEVAEQRRKALAGEILAERPYSRGRAYDPDRYSKNISETTEEVVDEPLDESGEN